MENLIERADQYASEKTNELMAKAIAQAYADGYRDGYEDCEALTVKTKAGNLVIYINQEHKSASPECIACLLAHESQHHTFTNSKAEELRAWISETHAWNEFLKRNKQLALSNEPLAKRENYIVKLRAKKGVAGIQKIIATNPVYAGLN